MREVGSWAEALGIGEREHIALVGGGGKTTTLLALAHELGFVAPTIVTSTTKACPVPDGMPAVLWATSADRDVALKAIESSFAGGAARVAVTADASGRIRGVSPDALDLMWDDAAAAFILNEADGARMKPLKAPAAHEPVPGETTTLTVILVGVDALGAPFDDEHVHRLAETLAATGGIVGQPVTADHVRRVVRTYMMKAIEQAPESRFALLLNKADEGTDAGALGDVGAEAERVIASGLVGGLRRLWRVR